MGAGLRHEKTVQPDGRKKVEVTLLTAATGRNRYDSPFDSSFSRITYEAIILAGRFCYGIYPYEERGVRYQYFECVPCDSIYRGLLLDDEIVTVEMCYGMNAREEEKLLHYVFSRPCPAGIVFLYCVCNSTTWEKLKVVMQNVLDASSSFAGDNSWRFMIVGCGCGLGKEREVDYETVKQYADEKGFLFFETSAKENINVEPAFVSFVAQLLDRHS